MKKLLLITLPLILASCLKEKDHNCPPAYSVEVSVGDMNYANVSSVPGVAPMDEQLPFGAFISDFYWQLQDLASGQIVASDAVNPGGNSKVYPFDFSAMSSGRYLFTVFGNVGNSQPDGQLITGYSLHDGMNEGTDLYRVSSILEFSPDYVLQRLPLIRTKGALLIQIDNLPDSVSKIVQQVYSVYGNINGDGSYQTETDVVKTFTSDLHPESFLFTRLAPSVTGKQSVIRLSLYAGQSESPFMFLPDIPFTVKRNEISAFRVAVKPEGGVEVWINSDGSWVKYHEINLN